MVHNCEPKSKMCVDLGMTLLLEISAQRFSNRRMVQLNIITRRRLLVQLFRHTRILVQYEVILLWEIHA
jgi:hypothetical protein